MANVEKISVSLSEELAAMVRGAVDTGDYASSSEVIRDALRTWKREQALRDAEIERLKNAWHKGIEGGSAGALNMSDIKREARAEFERRSKAAEHGR